MDTPEKKTVTQIGTPISKHKVQNSPVYNYIENLSPIRPVRSIPIAQTFGSLNFTSPPSVFTSPHAASRFRSHNNNSSKDESASTKEVASIREEEVEDASIEILESNCTTDTPGVVINDGGACEDGEMDLQKMCDNNVKPKNETPDWDTLIADASELLFFSPLPNDSEAFRCFLQRTSDSKARLSTGKRPTLEPVSNNNESESPDALSILHRGVRRRCLDFEMPGSNNNNNKQMSGESSSRCLVVPSIGLHLNAIAMSSKDNNVGNEYSLSGNVKVGLQGSTTPVLDIVAEEDVAAAQALEEEGPKSLALEEMNQSCPKKKRRKSDQAGGEGESSCKRCNCKKSKCLKLYCECFAAGVYCIEPCSCVDCFNKPIHEDVVLATRKQIESRNPLAFAPKVIRNSDSIMEAADDSSKTPASARHKRGCNCKKSNCLKKYCECYQSGVGCSINCRCEGCKNAFGKKDGSSFAGMDIEQDEENETAMQNRTAVLLPPSTPMPSRQPLAQLPITSNNMLLPQQSHHLHGASSGLYNKSQFRKQDMRMYSHSRIETITEERAEDIENLIQSPITNINAVSPNSKRVSLPDSSESTTPWRRNGGRKLLLSIPSFPSLTPHH
ncbi:unnamed protein product [Microthlaspi erraticum]|uniref:CRC domain-containing protein n=1 Tax=Microthlaspi erraticum TaxID=1685480 RepID=A0A6D2HGH8_9BRAS|nr:unnamed protein product [Microthlaspi erraticum]